MVELSTAQLLARFNERIRPAYDARIDTSEGRPTFVLIGGQPGAGKTESVAAAQLRVPTAIEVVGDDLRLFHPQYAELMATDPLRMPEVTQQAANAWVHQSLEYLRERRASVLMETTLRDPDAVHRTLSQFRDAGYEVQLQVIAVPAAVSRLGTLERYVGQVEREGSGRWAPSAVHDAAFDRAPESIAQVVRDGLVDRVIVQQRGDVTLLDAPMVFGDVYAVGNVLDALADGRRVERLTPGQASAWLHGVERASGFLAQYPQAVDADIEHTMRELISAAPEVARAAHPYDAQRRKAAAERIELCVVPRPVLDSLNPSGSVFLAHDPAARMNAPLGSDMTTFAETHGLASDAQIEVFRGVPREAETGIVPGDFVTTERQLAADYAGTGRVVSRLVSAGDVLDSVSEPHGGEYIYRPGAAQELAQRSVARDGPTSAPPKVTAQSLNQRLQDVIGARPKPDAPPSPGRSIGPQR